MSCTRCQSATVLIFRFPTWMQEATRQQWMDQLRGLLLMDRLYLLYQIQSTAQDAALLLVPQSGKLRSQQLLMQILEPVCAISLLSSMCQSLQVKQLLERLLLLVKQNHFHDFFTLAYSSSNTSS